MFFILNVCITVMLAINSYYKIKINTYICQVGGKSNVAAEKSAFPISAKLHI